MQSSSDYFETLKNELQKAYATAQQARSKGLDPELEVEVKITRDVAARVEGIVGPPGIAEIIRKMEQGGKSREDVAFEIAKMIASGEIIKRNKEQLLEQAVRTGLGILTEGVLVAPTEGIAKVRIKTNPDGSDFVAVYYAGPIRSAGGTAVALSVVLADIARRAVGIGDYRATDTQIERYVEEINIYEARVAHLQYKPPENDVRLVVQNCPVCVDGDPTEDIEASAFRNVPGVETNRVRGGIPLVICEGIAQKASKLLKYTKKLKLGWEWLEKIIKITRKEDKIEIKPDDNYLDGLVAGRPVFSYPSNKGGFRLRYGKSKTNGLMAKNIHPATMILLEGFLAFGTHMKIERPGKGCVIAPYEELEPPVVKLKDGSVTKVKTLEDAQRIKENVAEILFLGDLLITFGDFYKSNHPLLPSAWCKEWFKKECKEKGVALPSNEMSAKQAFEFSQLHNVPLHPDYTFNWHDISALQLNQLANWLITAKLKFDGEELREAVLKATETLTILEDLLVEYKTIGEEIAISGDYAYSLFTSLGMLENKELNNIKFATAFKEDKKTLDIVNELAGIKVKAKSPTYIGARMGRPEKAKERKMDGSPNVLFPTGSQKNRSILKVYRTLKTKDGEKTTNLDLARMRCVKCNYLGFYSSCDVCGSECKRELICQKCNNIVQSDLHCDNKTISFDRRPINVVNLVDEVKKKLDFTPEDVKGVKGLSNIERMPERLEKGFLRAKNDVYVFRDGTSRFDASNVPLTDFTPSEVRVSIEKLKALGYEKDHLGNPLTSSEQTVPLKVQDIILSESGAAYFIKVASFIDEMLVNMYGLPAFYNVKTKDDLVGHLCAGLSPHTSAAVLCRIIGFTDAYVGYAHPFLHAARRRNCDGDEDCIMLLLDSLINFSRHYLDEKRGGTMDAPLVLTPILDPKEVDDEAHAIEFVTEYPLEFYYATERFAMPSEVKIKTVKDVLGTPEQFEGIPLTHDAGSINKGTLRSTYVQLDSIPDKISIQFKLQGKIRAVDSKNAAERLILSHFIPDLYGNLRSFSRQTFRCVACNEIYRRVPLAGKCSRCGGNLLLTINKGGIQKYLEISRKIVEEYDLPIYLKQRLELVEREIKSIFEDEKIKQLGLADFI